MKTLETTTGNIHELNYEDVRYRVGPDPVDVPDAAADAMMRIWSDIECTGETEAEDAGPQTYHCGQCGKNHLLTSKKGQEHIGYMEE